MTYTLNVNLFLTIFDRSNFLTSIKFLDVNRQFLNVNFEKKMFSTHFFFKKDKIEKKIVFWCQMPQRITLKNFRPFEEKLAEKEMGLIMRGYNGKAPYFRRFLTYRIS